MVASTDFYLALGIGSGTLEAVEPETVVDQNGKREHSQDHNQPQASKISLTGPQILIHYFLVVCLMHWIFSMDVQESYSPIMRLIPAC